MYTRRRGLPGIVTALVALLAGAMLSQVAGSPADPPVRPPASARPTAVARQQAGRPSGLSRARVWLPPTVPVSSANLDVNPRGPASLAGDEMTCTFKQSQSRGMTPKFTCTLEGGEVVKVKSGAGNPEVFSEVAASRLLGALGFPVDEMYMMRRVRCLGCPAAAAEPWWRRALRRGPPEVIYEYAAVERRFRGRSLGHGWAFHELHMIDPRKGGATRAEVDALRLMAVFLAHWDNKAENHRLVCLGGFASDGTCLEPLAHLHDVGACFGPWKVSLASWRAQVIWSDLATCRVSLRRLPFKGGTFDEVRISEAGRAHLASLLGPLSEAQIEGLFTGARFPAYTGHTAEATEVGAWVQAFQGKVKEITDHRCP